MRPASPKLVRLRLWEYVQRFAAPEMPQNLRQHNVGALVQAFERVLLDAPCASCTDVRGKRHLVWGFCFTPADEMLRPWGAALLTSAQIFALKRWVGWRKEGEKWLPRAEFHYEARWMLSLADYIIRQDDRSVDAHTLGEWLEGMTAQRLALDEDGLVAAAIDLGGLVSEKEDVA